MLDRASRAAARTLAAVALSAALTGCASAGSFVWLQDLPPAEEPDVAPTRAAPGDLLFVQVWNAEQMESRQRVREDGTIALFFTEELAVEGLTTTQIAKRIEAALEGILVAPRVNVVLEEAAADMVSVLGEVARPGRYPLWEAPTVLAALSQAAGLTEFAKEDEIFVLRAAPEPRRIRVTWEQLLQGEDIARGFRLRAGDAVIVR